MLANYEANLAMRGHGDLSHRPGPNKPPGHRAIGLNSIWRRRRLVVFLTALALLPAILYVRLTTPLYTSTSNLLIGRTTDRASAPGANPNATTNSAQTQPMGAYDSISPEQLSAQCNVITSTPVLAVALATPGVMDCDPVRGRHDEIETLKRSLSLETTGGGLIAVSIASTSPDDASCIVRAVVDAYKQFLSSTRRNGNSEALVSLQQAKTQAQAELSSKTDDLLHFGEEHHVGVGDENSGAGAAELGSLAEAVNEAHVTAVGAKAADADLNRALEQDPARAQALKWFEESSPASGRTDTDDEELIRRELLQLKARQAELEQKFMPGHPALVNLQKRIEDLDLEHDAAIQRRAVSTAQRELDMRHAYNDEQKRILEQAAQQSEYSHRNAEVTQLQNNLDDLNRRIGSLDASTSSDLPTVTVLDPARASLEPTSPNRRRILSLAVALGFVLSCLLAFWLEGRAKAAIPDASGALHMPVLAVMPLLPTNFGPLGRGHRSLLSVDPVLDEIFDGIGSAIDGAKMRGRGVITLITSPSRGDGKSTLASNLAVYLAQTRKRVLLVDAGLRSPAQARLFGLEDVTGLATLLEAEVSIPITAIHHTGMPSLDVVPAGPLEHNPADLLNSQRFSDLLGDLAERYDYVLIDSPPTVTYTDARTISASADLTLMVIREDQPNRRMLQIASEGLTNVGANLIGVVLNSGQDEHRPDRMLQGKANTELKADRSSEEPPKRKLSNLVLALARAVDLVRDPADERTVRKLSYQNGQNSAPRSGGELMNTASASDALHPSI